MVAVYSLDALKGEGLPVEVK
jgi:hypothetical protein